MNPSSQIYSQAAMFADQDQAGQVYQELERILRALRFDAHVSRLQIKGQIYVSFLHEGSEASIPGPVREAVQRLLSQGEQLGPLPPEGVPTFLPPF